MNKKGRINEIKRQTMRAKQIENNQMEIDVEEAFTKRERNGIQAGVVLGKRKH